MNYGFHIYFFVGKGGVGKTTCAAAYSIVLANSGLKTLIVSLDPAHNLGDVFNYKLGETPLEIIDKLYAVEVDFDKTVKDHLKELTSKVKDIYGYLKVLNLDKYIDILRHSPGIEEYAILEKIIDIVQTNIKQKKYDVIVFDTPPTGLTIRIMALPSVSMLWIRKLIELRIAILDRRKILERIRGEKLKTIISGKELALPSSIEDDPIYRELIRINKRIELINNVFINPRNTSVFIVVNPETLPILEAYRAYGFLTRLGIPVKALIVNKVLKLSTPPKELEVKMREQDKASNLIDKLFKGMKIVRIPLLVKEPTGIKNLTEVSKYLTPLLELEGLTT